MTCIIYCIVPLPVFVREDTDMYVGSTTYTLKQRFTGHKSRYKSWRDGGRPYCSSFKLFDKFGVNGCAIMELERCPVENRKDREKYWIQNTPCCNQVRFVCDKKEFNRKYYESNREKIAEQCLEYREANRERIAEYHRQYYTKKKAEKEAAVNLAK